MKITLALIHNNDPIRFNNSLSVIKDLSLFLSEKDIKTEFVEFQYQPFLKPLLPLDIIIRDIRFYFLGLKWNSYLNNNSFKYLVSIKSLLNKLLSKKYYEKRKKSSVIELFLSDKHIRSWSAFLESESDYLIVFEDDALKKTDSFEQVNNMLVRFKKTEREYHYADLGGGFDIDALQLGNITKIQNGNWFEFKKGVTNTTCSYMMNRSLVNLFYEYIIKKPSIRFTGADWMINKLFILMEARQPNQLCCLHSFPSVFEHGSMHKYHQSSVR